MLHDTAATRGQYLALIQTGKNRQVLKTEKIPQNTP